jgi:hypothetical protein
MSPATASNLIPPRTGNRSTGTFSFLIDSTTCSDFRKSMIAVAVHTRINMTANTFATLLMYAD